MCDLSVITLNSEKLFISSSGLCPSWDFYELLANWARKKWLYSKLVLIFETSRLTPFTLQKSPLSRAEWKFALHFTAPVHHFTGASHLEPMIQLNRTCRAQTLFGIPPTLPTVLSSVASLQLPGNIRLDLKKSYQESGLNVGRPSRGLLQVSGQRCWWPKSSHKLWRLNWKYPSDIKEPEMRVC